MTVTYKEFVLIKLRDVRGETEEQVIDFMIRDWISSHSDYVEMAGASIQSWRAAEAAWLAKTRGEATS